MLPVPMTGNGPDMDAVEALAADPSVKGMWCVPKYSNPSGDVYSPETVRRLAAHAHRSAGFSPVLGQRLCGPPSDRTPAQHRQHPGACARPGNPDRAFIFASTSKITLAGAGLAFFGSSPANVAWYLARDVQAHHRRRQAEPVAPRPLPEGRGRADAPHGRPSRACWRRNSRPCRPPWNTAWPAPAPRPGRDPEGGYFISLDATPGTAKQVVALAGRRSGTDRRRLNLAARARSAGQQPATGPDISVAGGRHRRIRGDRALHPARRHRETLRLTNLIHVS